MTAGAGNQTRISWSQVSTHWTIPDSLQGLFRDESIFMVTGSNLESTQLQTKSLGLLIMTWNWDMCNTQFNPWMELLETGNNYLINIDICFENVPECQKNSNIVKFILWVPRIHQWVLSPFKKGQTTLKTKQQKQLANLLI